MENEKAKNVLRKKSVVSATMLSVGLALLALSLFVFAESLYTIHKFRNVAEQGSNKLTGAMLGITFFAVWFLPTSLSFLIASFLTAKNVFQKTLDQIGGKKMKGVFLVLILLIASFLIFGPYSMGLLSNFNSWKEVLTNSLIFLLPWIIVLLLLGLVLRKIIKSTPR